MSRSYFHSPGSDPASARAVGGGSTGPLLTDQLRGLTMDAQAGGPLCEFRADAYRQIAHDRSGR